jgi:hypothetical protein
LCCNGNIPACEDAVLDALVLFFILVSLVELSFRDCRLWYLHVWALEVNIRFVLLDEGTVLGSFSIFMYEYSFNTPVPVAARSNA